MKPVYSLFDPSSDAINYLSKSKAKAFHKLYNTTEFYNRIQNDDCYFVIGEKGSGKTSLALYYEMTPGPEQCPKLVPLSETDYKNFISLKNSLKLNYTDYASIWRTSLLRLIAHRIMSDNARWHDRFTRKFRRLRSILAETDRKVYFPDMQTTHSYKFVQKDGGKVGTGKLLKVEVNSEFKEETQETTEVIRLRMAETEKAIKDEIQKLKIDKSTVILIDGVDARPNDVPLKEYTESIKGLIEGFWELNTGYLNVLENAKQPLRICILLRPDVFDQLNVYNSSSRIHDNSVFLRWETTEKTYFESPIFETVDKYFRAQNETSGEGWDNYFPMRNLHQQSLSFLFFIKKSFIRPRDFFVAISYLIRQSRIAVPRRIDFDPEIFNTPTFIKYFSDHLLGEVRNTANFYISNRDFDSYITIFQILRKKEFTLKDFLSDFERFRGEMDLRTIENRSFYSSANTLLQFLYEVNMLGYFFILPNGQKEFHWAFRDRMPNLLNPKVVIEEHITYRVMAGIERSLSLL